MEIPSVLLTPVLEYSRLVNPRTLRHVSKAFKNVMDDSTNPVWAEMMKKYNNPKVPGLLWASSKGCTALIMRQSVLQHCCVSCSSNAPDVAKNPFYGVYLCTVCQILPIFRIQSLRKACNYFFLDFKTQKDNPYLLNLKIGNLRIVLVRHVQKIATETHSADGLWQMIDERQARADALKSKRIEYRDRRAFILKAVYAENMAKYPSRVDAVFQDYATLHASVQQFGAWQDVYEDFYDLKISPKISPTEVARRESDFAQLLTHMKKLDVLGSDSIQPRHVFRKFRHSGPHFYDQIQELAQSDRELKQRSAQVQEYIRFHGSNMNRPLRRSLAIALCVEDDIDYNPNFFKEYVISGIGNPCEIARDLRCQIFLDRHDFQATLISLLNRGFSVDQASSCAKRGILERTYGFPPMVRVCEIMLTTSVIAGGLHSQTRP